MRPWSNCSSEGEQQAKEQRELDKKREKEAAVARKEQEAEAAMNRMAKSIETIKYCVFSISSVMALAPVIGILVLMEVERETERIKGEVAAIEREAERIYEKLSNPFQAPGAGLRPRVEEEPGTAPKLRHALLAEDRRRNRKSNRCANGKVPHRKIVNHKS